MVSLGTREYKPYRSAHGTKLWWHGAMDSGQFQGPRDPRISECAHDEQLLPSKGGLLGLGCMDYPYTFTRGSGNVVF